MLVRLRPPCNLAGCATLSVRYFGVTRPSGVCCAKPAQLTYDFAAATSTTQWSCPERPNRTKTISIQSTSAVVDPEQTILRFRYFGVTRPSDVRLPGHFTWRCVSKSTLHVGHWLIFNSTDTNPQRISARTRQRHFGSSPLWPPKLKLKYDCLLSPLYAYIKYLSLKWQNKL